MPATRKIVEEALDAFRSEREQVVEYLQKQRSRSRSRKQLIHAFRDVFLLVAGTLAAGFGLKGFLIPARFIDGGVTGISLLANRAEGLSIPLLIFLLNIPFVVISNRQFSRVFTIKSLLATLALAAVVAFFPFPVITQDKTLVSVFGGFFVGAGLGLCIRGGGIIDGTEVLAVFLSRKFSFSVGDIVLLFNIILFSVAAYLLSVEVALYSILTYPLPPKPSTL